MSDLSGLIARVEKAAGPDREIDAKISTVLLPDQWRARKRGESFGVGSGVGYAVFIGDGAPSYNPTPSYTSSLDAVVALVERELPGYPFELGRSPKRANALIVVPDSKGNYIL